MKPRLFYSDHFVFELPAGHKFPIRKYALLRQALESTGGFELREAPFASSHDLRRAHDPVYVEQVMSGEVPAAVMRRIGFPWSEMLVRRTLASVGGTLAATAEALGLRYPNKPDPALEHPNEPEFVGGPALAGSGTPSGWGGNLAGGTHHAFRSEGSGYCVFNDIAVAAMWARQQGVRRLAIVDCDVHQGDGTAQIFADDPQIFTLSLHGRKNFPFRKQRSRLDLELEDGAGDEEYLRLLEDGLNAVFGFGPELIFFQAGVDALACDQLGRLALSEQGLMCRDRLLFERCRRLRVPVVITLGGGYGKPIEATVSAHANTFRSALEIFSPQES